METMLCSASAFYDEKEECWIVTVTSDITDYPYRKYKIKAGNEFVAPIAILEMHGFNVLECLKYLKHNGWFVEDIT